MKHADYLRQMLAPLGVYRLEGTCNGGELEAVGAALDGCAAALETVERDAVHYLPPGSTGGPAADWRRQLHAFGDQRQPGRMRAQCGGQ